LTSPGDRAEAVLVFGDAEVLSEVARTNPGSSTPFWQFH
jgi:hypothetical protein